MLQLFFIIKSAVKRKCGPGAVEMPHALSKHELTTIRLDSMTGVKGAGCEEVSDLNSNK
jgi:hypothetical protein